MDSKTIFVRTDKGEEEIRGRSQSLSGDIRRALLMVDGSSSFGEISKRAAPSMRAILDDSIKDLLRSGFILDKARAAHAGNVPKMVVPVKTPPTGASRVSPAMKQPSVANLDELDFTAAFRAPTPDALAAEGAKLEAERLKAEAQAEAMRLKAEQEAVRARKEIEAAKLKAQQEAEAARLKAEQEAMRAREEAEQAKRLMAQAQAKAEAEARARKEIEAARSKAQLEADAARRKAEQEALLAREEAEAARLKAEQEATQIRAELARAQAKAEAESRAYAEAAASARKEIEAVKLKAQQDAEAARLKAEQESIAAREEAELARRQAAEAARLKAEQEAAQARAELAEAQAKAEAEKARQQAAEAQAKAEAEAVAHAEAEVRARKEIEAAKLRAQQEAEVLRLKAEQDAAQAREEVITARAEAEQAKRLVAEAQARAEAEALAHAEIEAKIREEAETAKLKAQKEAEALRLKAEQDVATARVEAEQAQRHAEAAALARKEVEHRAKTQAEEARLKAEQEAARAQAELAEAQTKAEAELSMRQAAEAELELDAEAAMLQVQQEVETARIKAEQDAELAREDAEQLKRQAVEAKAQVHEDAELKVQREADAARIEEASLKAEQEAQRLARMAATLKSAGAEYQRSTSATVLFFDVVGYTRQPVNKQIKIKKLFNQLVSDCLAKLGDDERIILDTGDGAAIGFLQHPEDALQVAREFREVVTGHQHKDYPELEVRTGIHLGPVSIVKDMNGQSNMVGDGINDAQRVMSFAGIDQIYISRPYYDFISRLSDEYAELFQYRGLQQDKHGREHAVYELVDLSVVEVKPHTVETLPPITLEPFVFSASEVGVTSNAPMEQVEPIHQPAPVSGAFTEITLMDMSEVSPPEAPVVEVLPPAASVEQAAPPAQVEPPAKQESKPVADAHMPSEEDVAAMAAAQAKVWNKAEQRAAMKKEEHVAHAHQPVSREEKQVVRARRKPVPWGKVGAGLFALIIVALFVAPFVLPMRDYANGIEQALAARLKQPVHIGQISGRILPMPRLELGDVSIGDAGQVSVKLARLDFAISALFSSTKAIDSLALDGVQVNGAVLLQLSDWLLQMAVDTQYPVGHVELSQGALQAEGLQLSGIAGELNFDATGLFTQAKMHTADGKLALDIDAVAEGRTKTVMSVRGSALPLLPAWTFDELIVTGELTRDRLIVSDLDGSIMDGRLLGNLDISWADGWQAKGDLLAKVITVQKLGTALSGDMDGSARFRMKADSLAKLVDSSVMEGSFVVSKGVISGFDIVETTRLRSRESQPGGRTHFDELSGDLSFENGSYRFRRLRVKAGVLNATGSLDVANQQLSGQASADLSMSSGSVSAGLQVGGTTSAPTLRVR